MGVNHGQCQPLAPAAQQSVSHWHTVTHRFDPGPVHHRIGIARFYNGRVYPRNVTDSDFNPYCPLHTANRPPWAKILTHCPSNRSFTNQHYSRTVRVRCLYNSEPQGQNCAVPYGVNSDHCCMRAVICAKSSFEQSWNTWSSRTWTDTAHYRLAEGKLGSEHSRPADICRTGFPTAKERWF